MYHAFQTEALIFVEWFRKTFPDVLFPDGLSEAHLKEYPGELRQVAQEVRLEGEEAARIIKLRWGAVLTYCTWLSAEDYMAGDLTDSIRELTSMLPATGQRPQ